MTIQEAADAMDKLRYLAQFGERHHGPAIRMAAWRAYDGLGDLIRLLVEKDGIPMEAPDAR